MKNLLNKIWENETLWKWYRIIVIAGVVVGWSVIILWGFGVLEIGALDELKLNK
ncbi:hypothetical protein LCGC14_1777620 [marine sediment metagenome]|uniref:Uncharacterized protein n=1 Tax=marine sediment metagenome TaxID=412755 RepID=A0A0F9GWH0_9ZZZZ